MKTTYALIIASSLLLFGCGSATSSSSSALASQEASTNLVSMVGNWKSSELQIDIQSSTQSNISGSVPINGVPCSTLSTLTSSPEGAELNVQGTGTLLGTPPYACSCGQGESQSQCQSNCENQLSIAQEQSSAQCAAYSGTFSLTSEADGLTACPASGPCFALTQ